MESGSLRAGKSSPKHGPISNGFNEVYILDGLKNVEYRRLLSVYRARRRLRSEKNLYLSAFSFRTHATGVFLGFNLETISTIFRSPGPVNIYRACMALKRNGNAVVLFAAFLKRAIKLRLIKPAVME